MWQNGKQSENYERTREATNQEDRSGIGSGETQRRIRTNQNNQRT